MLQYDGQADNDMRAILLSAAFIAGCSINGLGIPGSVERTVIQNENIRIVRTRAAGLHAYTEAASGIHLGVIDRLLAYPVTSDSPDHCVAVALGKDAVQPVSTNSDSGPVHIEVRRAGGTVELGAWALSLRLGVGKVITTRVSPSESMTFWYDSRFTEPGAHLCAAIYREEEIRK